MFRSILKWGAVAFGVLIVIGALTGKGDTPTPVKPEVAQAESKAPTKTTAKPSAKVIAAAQGDDEQPASKPAPTPKPKPSMTRGQENALESAESYLDGQSFSKTGLAQQLKFEKYDAADVRFAINHVKADYNAEAVEAAEGYLDGQSFSKPELLGQLKFEGYTPAQAQQAVDKAY